MHRFGSHKTLLGALFILILSVIFFYPVIFEGKTFYAFDILSSSLPWRSFLQGPVKNTLISDPVVLDYPFHHYVKRWVVNGSFPLWNGSTFCGLPIPAGGISAYSNPVVFFSYMLFPILTAHDFLLWFHLVGTGLFMLLYLREMELDVLPAIIGSLTWMFSGIIMVWFEWKSWLILALALPATLYFFERWLVSRSICHCLLFTLAVAYSISSGFPHIVIYQMLFVFFYMVYRFALTGKPGGQSHPARKVLLHLGLSLLLCLLISALFIVAHVSTLEDLQRAKISFWDLYGRTGRLPARYLATLLFPYLFGSPIHPLSFTQGTTPYSNFNELCIYAGIPAIFLAVGCLPFAGRKYVGFFLLTAILAITMSMGSILYYPLAEFIPGLNLSTPTRINYLFGFSVSVLAGLAAHILSGTEDVKKKRAVFALWGLLFAFGVGISLLVQTREGMEWAAGLGAKPDREDLIAIVKPHFHMLSSVIIKPLLLISVSFYLLSILLFVRKRRSRHTFLFLLLVVLAFDLVSFGMDYNTAAPKEMAYPATDAIAFLKTDRSLYRVVTYGKFVFNGLAPFGIDDVGGYCPIFHKRYGDYLHLSQWGPDVPLPEEHSRWTFFCSFGSPLLDLVNVKYLLLPKDVEITHSPQLELAYDGEIRIYRNRSVFPRVFLVPDYEVLAEGKDVYRAMGRFTAEDFKRKVILEKSPPSGFPQETPMGKGQFSYAIRILSYTPDKIEIDITTEAKGFLVMSDNYHPGWRAEVDGKAAEILRANYIMRALPLIPGNHRITLTFRPEAIIGGVLLTTSGWTALLVLLLLSLWLGKGGHSGSRSLPE